MKRVKLDYGHDVTITDEAFAQIEAITNANKVCEGCGNVYSSERPNFALNLCITCFQRKYTDQNYTYAGEHDTNWSGETIHWFVDPLNVVYSTTTGSRDPQRDWYYTLLYWGFPVPRTWQDGEETKEINYHLWSIEGNVKTDQVIFIKNSLDYGSERSVDFLSWKDGRTLQIDRRKGEGRRLFLAAKKQIEETKDEHGSYHMGEHTMYSIETYWLRKVVVQLANEEYRKQRLP